MVLSDFLNLLVSVMSCRLATLLDKWTYLINEVRFKSEIQAHTTFFAFGEMKFIP